MNWNPVANMVFEIKHTYLKEFGGISVIPKRTNSLEYWVERLCKRDEEKYSHYRELISKLQVSQCDWYILIRYADYSSIYSGEQEANTDENFWDRHNGFYRECRSVVLDLKKEEIVLCPFKKFFNLNEMDETKVEEIQKHIKKATVVEFSDKMDGSMQSARWYDGKIFMAGSQAVDSKYSWRLADGYKMIYEKPGYEKMLKDYPNTTFIFEYISLKDAHVVKYKKEEEGLYLIGMRDVMTGEESSYKEVLDMAAKYEIPTTKTFDKSLDEILEQLDEKSSDEAEGFVINIDGYKVKVKYNDYVNIHRVLSALTSINLVIKCIADNTFDDMLSKIPNAHKNRVLDVAKIVFDYINATESEIKKYFDNAPKDNKKDFMIWVDANTPKKIRPYVRAKYLGDPYNVIKTSNGRYLKISEMGVENWKDIFREEETDYE